jgi:hypothetical protein
MQGEFDDVMFIKLRNKHVVAVNEHQVAPGVIDPRDVLVRALFPVAQLKRNRLRLCHMYISSVVRHQPQHWCRMTTASLAGRAEE